MQNQGKDILHHAKQLRGGSRDTKLQGYIKEEIEGQGCKEYSYLRATERNKKANTLVAQINESKAKKENK